MKKGKKSIVTVILALILAVTGGVIYDNEGETPQESSQQVEVLQESQQEVQEEADTGQVEEANESAQEEAPVIEDEAEDKVEEAEETEEVEVEFADEPELTFRKEYNLTSHYEKHGIEMGFDSAEEYLEAANAVVNNPDSLHKLEGEDGDDVYYLEATNEFVVVSKDGYIRTYFNPSDGLDYFNRQ